MIPTIEHQMASMSALSKSTQKKTPFNLKKEGFRFHSDLEVSPSS